MVDRKMSGLRSYDDLEDILRTRTKCHCRGGYSCRFQGSVLSSLCHLVLALNGCIPEIQQVFQALHPQAHPSTSTLPSPPSSVHSHCELDTRHPSNHHHKGEGGKSNLDREEGGCKHPYTGHKAFSRLGRAAPGGVRLRASLWWE